MARALVALLWLLAVGASAGGIEELRKKEEQQLKKIGRKFLTEKAKEKGVVRLPSGVLIKVIKRWTGKLNKKRSPLLKDVVNVTYSGQLHGGEKFDSGTKTFVANTVIPGWREALQLMCAGEKWEIVVPSELAYGSKGGNRIPPHAPLVFSVELHGITSKQKGPGKGRTCADARWELEAKIDGWSLKYFVWWMSSTKAGQVLGIIASILMVVLAVVMEYKYWCRRRRRGTEDQGTEAPGPAARGTPCPTVKEEPAGTEGSAPKEGSKKDD